MAGCFLTVELASVMRVDHAPKRVTCCISNLPRANSLAPLRGAVKRYAVARCGGRMCGLHRAMVPLDST